jgi:hypothetical protein
VPIPDELVYATDETGIQSGIGVWERVIGPAGQQIQNQQCSGNRENITVIVTIQYMLMARASHQLLFSKVKVSRCL